VGTLPVSGIQLATILTSMNAEYFLINDSGNRQDIETVNKYLPQPDTISVFTWDGNQMQLTYYSIAIETIYTIFICCDCLYIIVSY